MMISPDTYYEEFLKGKTSSEIWTVIRSLKSEITHLKNVIEHPDYCKTSLPDEYTRIQCNRHYLERAKQALGELGEVYTPSQAERRAIQFDRTIPEIKSITLDVSRFTWFYFQTHELTVHSNGITKWVEEAVTSEESAVSNYSSDPVYSLDAFYDLVRELHLGEWRKNYSTERFGIFVLDGTQWEMKISYCTDRKPVIFSGDNAYPYNFEAVKQLFGIDEL